MALAVGGNGARWRCKERGDVDSDYSLEMAANSCPISEVSKCGNRTFGSRGVNGRLGESWMDYM